MKLLLALTSVIISLTAYAHQDIEKIIGDDDLTAVNADASNIPLRYRRLTDAFGHMSMGCTATHIGNGYVLTAGHCFYASDEVTEDKDCSDITIEWGFREGVEPYLNSTCEKIIVAQRNDSNDYALLRVFPVPPAAIAPDMNRRAIIGDTVTIFSHPEELSLRWSHACGIEREQHPGLPKNAFHHKCDTNPGSSGATVLNILSLKVIGIHDGGTNSEGGMNYGTYIMNSPLRDYLLKAGF